MGCDIHGFIEVELYKEYRQLIDIGCLQGRNYDLFGLLFGVRGYAGFKPIAEARGIPSNVNEETKKEYDEWGYDAHNASFITAKEIIDYNWETLAEEKDGRISVYDKIDGKWVYNYKFAWSSNLDKFPENVKELQEKGETIIEDKLYKHDLLKAKDVVDNGWECIFDLMKVLAKYHGEDKVRLVVWFDN